MLVVLEGCDGTGKTTLAKFLSKLLNADIVHCTAKTPNDYEFFDNIISAAMTRNIIADRFCYGQFVYQKKEDRHLTKDELHRLETRILDAEGKVVLVTAPEELVMARLAARGEVTLIPVPELLSRFETLMSESILPVIRYDANFAGNKLEKENIHEQPLQ